MTEAAVFMSGNSQAVRLPKPFRFQGSSVEIFRRGDEVVLREKRQTLAQALGDWPEISADEARAWAEAIRDAAPPPQDRDWTNLLGTPPAP
ncbi:MAG TPA: AbrB/MazE/SpoVT family DNA-binding domain-containing protein [Burkholderiaceae bacterium]|nr:AbrB/MazE/SpoVT family DNA-binding domain-containing protein [Burkholderiaceae bacterium]